MTIKVDPLTPAVGAEVTGLDVTRLDDESFAVLWGAFVHHSVVFLRDQPEMTVEEHLALAQRFGSVHVHPFARIGDRNGDDGQRGVLPIRTTSESTVAAGHRWHSDVSCDDRPPQASILQLHHLPPNGGDTLFASTLAAYDTLSDRLKRYLDGLTARHSGEESYRKLFKVATIDPSASWPEADHPIVRRHADNGRPGLYVNREFTESINDLPREEGRSLLNFLFEHCERPEFQCRFRWSTNAIAIWDNRAVLHHAMWDYWPNERRGRRISVVGERPVAWHIDGNSEATQRSDGEVRLTA